MLGVTACAPEGDPGVASSPPPSAAAASEGASPEGADGTEAEAGTETETGAGICSDLEFGQAASVPVPLSDLDVPFYPCTHEMAAITDPEPFFVGEYVTNHELIIVEMAITDQFDESDWEVTERSVEGDNAITAAQKPGYSLVVVVGPTRAVDTGTSIHYTLHTR